MTKLSKGYNTRIANSNRIFEVEPYSRTPVKSFDDLNDDLKLKKHLQRAVGKTRAPQSLVDSIRFSIRK